MRHLISKPLIALVFFASILSLGATLAQATPLSSEPKRVIYQVYLQSFQDGALKDGEGDFLGLEQRLPYLKDLGATALLLMPVFEGSGGMGYIPTDNFVLRQDYGATADVKARENAFTHLVNAAHGMGMKILLDVVLNHIGTDSVWFQNSEHRVPGFEDWFRWSNQPNTAWKRPWDPIGTYKDIFILDPIRNQYYYALFASGMPDLNHENPAVQSEMLRFFNYWAARGADGFRIDAAKHFVEGQSNANPVEPKNLALLKHYLQSVRQNYPDTSFLLEAWSDHYADFEPYVPDSGDVVFDFAFMDSVRDSVKNSHPWAVRNSLKHMEQVQDTVRPGNRIVLSGNHDVPRIRSYYGESRGKSEISLALTLLLPWEPLIYYGDEIFMPGDYVRTTGKEKNEVGTPMAWTADINAGFADPSVVLGNDWNKKIHADFRVYNVASEGRDPQSMLAFVKTLVQRRAALPIDNDTRISVDNTDPNQVLLQYALHFSDGTCAEVYLNFSDRDERQVHPEKSTTGCPRSIQDKFFSARSNTTVHDDGSSVITLEAQGIWVGYAR